VNRYEGFFSKGRRQGVGVYFYSNGSKYVGEWDDNLKHGYAMFYSEDGQVLKGIFEEDRMAKKLLDDLALVEVTHEFDLAGNWDETKTVNDPFSGTENHSNNEDKNVSTNSGKSNGDLIKVDETPAPDRANDVLEQTPAETDNRIGTVQFLDGNANVNIQSQEINTMANTQTNTMYKTGQLKNKNRKADVNPNPYISILDVDDMFDHHPSLKGKIYPWLLKMLLSRHSDLL
jgi:hypothetical protein